MNNPSYYPIEIRKPLYSTSAGDYVCIRDKYINEAIRNRQFLKIITPNTEAIYPPKHWRKIGKKIEKEFLIKGVPMTLFCGFVPLRKKQTEDEKSEEMVKVYLR